MQKQKKTLKWVKISQRTNKLKLQVENRWNITFATNWQLGNLRRITRKRQLTAAVSRSSADLAAARSCSLFFSDCLKSSLSALQWKFHRLIGFESQKISINQNLTFRPRRELCSRWIHRRRGRLRRETRHGNVTRFQTAKKRGKFVNKTNKVEIFKTK